MKNARQCRALETTELLAWVDDVVATVVRACCVVGAGDFLFTVRYGFHLAVFHALCFQDGSQGLRAFLAQGQVVLGAAAVIGVTFDFDCDVRVSRQELGVVSYQRIEFWLDNVFVEVEEDATVFVDRAVWVQVRWQRDWRWHWCWGSSWCWCWRRCRNWRRCWGWCRCWGRASAQQSDGAGCQQDIGVSFHRNYSRIGFVGGGTR